MQLEFLNQFLLIIGCESHFLFCLLLLRILQIVYVVIRKVQVKFEYKLFHHEAHEDHEGNQKKLTSALRVLRSLRGHKGLS
jgi:hypothetical protein